MHLDADVLGHFPRNQRQNVKLVVSVFHRRFSRDLPCPITERNDIIEILEEQMEHLIASEI